MRQTFTTAALLLGLLFLAACQSETSRFEGKWRSVLLDGTTIILNFEGKGKNQMLTMETTVNALTERERFPVEIIGDGVYAGEHVTGMVPGKEIVYLESDDRLTSELGTFKR